MGVLCGIVGKRDEAAVKAMLHALRSRPGTAEIHSDTHYAIAGTGPDPRVLVDGAPLTRDGQSANLVSLHKALEQSDSTMRPDIRGPFACAFLAATGPRAWLMRDRLGRKPLYYHVGDGFLIFASELKALLASGLVPRHLRLRSVDRFLTLRCVPEPDTIFQEVYRVRPGHMLEFDRGQVKETQFDGFHIESIKRTRDASAEHLLGHLSRSVEHLADNHLLLSSGLDSALLGALMGRPRALHVSMEKTWQNELRQTRESASRLDADMEVRQGRRLTKDIFLSTVRCLDEPVADANVFPLSLMLEAAAKEGTSWTTGHGADELLGGYPRYHFLQKAQGAQSLVPVNLLSGFMPALPPNAFVRRAGRYLTSIHDDARAMLSLISVFDADERDELYTEAMKSALREQGDPESVLREYFTESRLTPNLMHLDLHVGLPDLLLAPLDRLASAHGVELHFPYLDDNVIDFVLTLPSSIKFGVRSKPLLRIAAKDLLPPRTRLRARRGFHMPQGGRVAGVIEQIADEIISEQRVYDTGLFKWNYVKQVVRSAGHNVYRLRQFWALLMFFAWHHEVMED